MSAVPEPLRAPVASLAPGASALEADAPDLVEACAAEFVARQGDGELVERAEFHARLAGSAQRERFDELVGGAACALRVLPRLPVLGGLFRERYEIVRLLGEGGEGRVYLARDRELGRLVAIKVRSALGRADAENQQRLLKESRLLAALQHPNIVAVHDWGLDGDLAYLVMDYVDGNPLDLVLAMLRERAEKSNSGRITLRSDAWTHAIARPLAPGRASLVDERDTYATAARIALELARTIEVAHAQGVFHRDLKPANVLLTGGGHPVVLDFGLAGRADATPGDVTRGFFGSAPYLAPEQVRDERVGCAASSDVYQLGLVLYELLTLQRAFTSPATGQVLEQIRRGEFPAPSRVNPGVPRALDAICMRALELKPASRYASVRALREDLEAYLSGTSVPVALRSDRSRAFLRGLRAAGKRHPAALGLVFVALAATVAWNLGGRAHAADSGLYKLFLVSSDGSREYVPAERAPTRPVREGDQLGVELRPSEPIWVYTLSVSTNAAGAQMVSPVYVHFVAMPGASATPARRAGFGVEVPACVEVAGDACPRLVCSNVEAPNRTEGLLVFSCARPLDEVEVWMNRIHELGGVPLQQLCDEFPTVVRERGSGALDPTRTAELESARAGIERARSHPGEEQRVAGISTLLVSFPVAAH